ncbi:type IX secretion system membrane protein PorP/SprF [Pedobacter polaris]|uniref:Type IX secretion system membrane protein PorP/SprF n=1 Tax=Pedobacter polaris TaxID=2571273 RepID=A0A4U1CQG0_9SPHI|nr:PorP/SprF family type IX secretion system membrane protein [Pedobacter polaris]TKC09873.1 type IX secretion system membrane protein PorP/SprF [Pedobacter polaris]
MKIYILLVVGLMTGFVANAQLMPLGATFYFNQYLGNPAMAGLNEGLHLNAGLNQQWSAVPGSPSAQYITVDRRSNKVGLGLSLYADKAGLLKRTRVVGSYAYHLPLNAKNDQLHFGISLGALSERLATEEINGSISDIAAQRFNERDAVLDGDFGMAYTTGKITIQGAIPNLKNFLKKEQYNTANWNTFYTAVSYKFMTDSTTRAFMIEPKLSFRGVRGYEDVIDAGVNVATASNKFYASSIYHSTKSISFGMGFNYNNFAILGMYTSGTSALKNYSSGNFEIGLVYSFKKN